MCSVIYIFCGTRSFFIISDLNEGSSSNYSPKQVCSELSVGFHIWGVGGGQIVIDCIFLSLNTKIPWGGDLGAGRLPPTPLTKPLIFEQ